MDEHFEHTCEALESWAEVLGRKDFTHAWAGSRGSTGNLTVKQNSTLCREKCHKVDFT